MEDAIDDCEAKCTTCNDDSVHAWDEAVAFYTGSLEGKDPREGGGKMLYALADKRCKNFKTCTDTAGHVSSVNTEIFKQFNLGKAKLLKGECGPVRDITDKIISQMTIPLVQGSLRYAYKVDKLQGGSKEAAEGAVFSAAVLPMVASCDAVSAKTISDNMKIESDTKMSDGFVAVKQAFEKVYSCMGINCASVGGLIITGSEYYDHAQPCGLSTTTPVASVNSAWHSRGNKVCILVLVASIVTLLAN